MSVNRLALLICGLILIVLWGGTNAFASPESDSEFSMSLPGVRLLELERTSIEFTPDGGDFQQGFTDQEIIVARIWANVEWVLIISGSDPAWEGPWAKPVSDIYWRCGSGQFVPLSQSGAAVFQGGPDNNRSVPVHVKVKLDWAADVPGEYLYKYVLFELTSP